MSLVIDATAKQRTVATKSVLRYPGGKTRAIPVLDSFLPSGTREIVSPFFGGGSFEIACANKGVKVYGSDIFEPLINFWHHLLDDAEALAQRVDVYNPLSHAKFYSLQKTYLSIEDPMERAAVFFVLNRSSYSGTTLSGGMSPKHPRFNEGAIRRLREFFAPDVSVEHLDFEEAFEKYPNSYMYLDPPYLIDQALYGHKGDTHNGFDHERLCQLLHERKSGWMLSYNDSPQIREMYSNFRIEQPEWSYGMANVKSNHVKRSNELLILAA